MEIWMEANHQQSDGIWLQFYKKGSGVASVDYAKALDVALCFGWIDGQLRPGDDKFYLQRFTPRRPRSTWSKRNVEHVARLTAEQRIRPAGYKAIEEAKADGRWENAYDSHRNLTIPDYFLTELNRKPESLAFFESISKMNRYAIIWRLQSARNEVTRAKRMEQLLQMLAEKKVLHPNLEKGKSKSNP